MSPRPLKVQKVAMPTIINQRPTWTDNMNLLQNATLDDWPFHCVSQFNELVVAWRPPMAPLPTWATNLHVVCALAVRRTPESNPEARCIPFYVVHYDGEARPLLQCNVFQPMCDDVAMAYAGVSIMQPHVFEIAPGDMHLSIMARVTPSVAKIKYSLLRLVDVNEPPPLSGLILHNYLKRVQRRLTDEHGLPRIWALGPDNHTAMAFVTNAVELTGPSWTKAHLELETTCATLFEIPFQRLGENWREWSEEEKRYIYSPNGLYPMIEKYVNPPACGDKLTMFGANYTNFMAATYIPGAVFVHPARFQWFWGKLAINPSGAHYLKITEVPPIVVPFTEDPAFDNADPSFHNGSVLYTTAIHHLVAGLWDKVHELYRSVHINEQYAGLWGSSCLWIGRPVYGQYQALYELLKQVHSIFVVQHQATERDEKRKKTPFGTNKQNEEPMGALQQLIVNQFAPIALGTPRGTEGRVVSSRFFWHFPASRAMIIVCLQGTITLHIPGFRDVCLIAPQAVVLPGKLWHQATFAGPTVPQTLTMVY